MKNDTSNGMTRFTELSAVDPAVESLLGQGRRRQEKARLPRTERSRVKKECERAEKRKPNRINLDLPVDLKKCLEQLAKQEGVPISQLVAFLLFEPVAAAREPGDQPVGLQDPLRLPQVRVHPGPETPGHGSGAEIVNCWLGRASYGNL